MKTRMFIDSEKLTVTVITTYGRGFNFKRKEINFSIRKGVKLYGLDNEVEHIANKYNAEEVVYCNL